VPQQDANVSDTRDVVFDAVVACISDELRADPAQVTVDTNLSDDLGATSLTIVELTVALEEKFDISVPDKELMAIKTVGDLFDLVRTKSR
jgi:acyl carrier protein